MAENEENENEVEEEDGDLFGLLVWLIFLMFLMVGGAFFILSDEWWPTTIALSLGVFWLILAFFSIPPAFAGLVLRFGGRVVLANGEYLIKKEGWTFIFPIVERIVKISLQQHEEVINKQRQNENDDDYKNRAESFTTSEGVSIFPALFCLYRVKYLGKVIELEGDIDEWGVSPALTKMIHDFVLSGARGIMAKMEITEILNREVKEENGDRVPIGEKIKNEMINAPNFEKLGAEVLVIRLLDVKFTKEAQEILDALEEIKRQRLEMTDKLIEADQRFQIQQKDSETLVNKATAELEKARKEALAKNADIAAFVGKAVDGKTTTEDGKAYAQYQIGLEVAKSLGSGTKVIIPAGDVSKVMAGLVNVFEAAKPDASK